MKRPVKARYWQVSPRQCCGSVVDEPDRCMRRCRTAGHYELRTEYDDGSCSRYYYCSDCLLDRLNALGTLADAVPIAYLDSAPVEA